MRTNFKKTTTINLDTPHGRFLVHLYEDPSSKDKDDPFIVKHHLALTMGEVNNKANVLVRVQSKCLLNETFGDLECDCGQQLHHAMELIAQKGEGIIVYLMQDGKGIGLANKIKAIKVCQEKGMDMYDAFIDLGFKPDERSYDVVADILEDLGVQSPIQLMTNSPDKIQQLAECGIQANRVAIEMPVTDYNRKSLTYKKNKMGHLLHEII